MYAQYFVNNNPITSKILIGTYQVFVEQYPIQPRVTDIEITSLVNDYSLYHDLEAMRMALIGDLRIFNSVTNYVSFFRRVRIMSFDIQTFDMYSINSNNEYIRIVWRGINCITDIRNTVEQEVDWIHEGF